MCDNNKAKPPQGEESTTEVDENISFFRAFFTQSDFSNRVSRETWFGHHGPWRRILCFMVLSCLTSTVVILVFLHSTGVPILKYQTSYEIQEMKNSHYECARSLCVAAKNVTLECVVNPDGKGAHADFDSYVGPDLIPIPHACVVAGEKTFGLSWRDKGLEADQMMLFQITPRDDMFKGKALFKLRADCHVEGYQTSKETNNVAKVSTFKDANNLVEVSTSQEANNLVEVSTSQETNNLVKDFTEAAAAPLMYIEDMEPGERKGSLVNQMFCPDEMAPEIRNVLIPAIQLLYDWFLVHRNMVFVAGFFSAALLFQMWRLCKLMVMLLLPAILVRWLLPWRKDCVGSKSVTFWTSWSTLVLICYITTERHFIQSVEALFLQPITLLLCILVSVSLFHYKDKKAAIEWAFLGTLWLCAHDVYPMLDFVRSQVKVFDYFDIVGWLGSWLAYFIPGQGWWKLVPLYACCRSYMCTRGGNTMLENTQSDNQRDQIDAIIYEDPPKSE